MLRSCPPAPAAGSLQVRSTGVPEVGETGKWSWYFSQKLSPPSPLASTPLSLPTPYLSTCSLHSKGPLFQSLGVHYGTVPSFRSWTRGTLVGASDSRCRYTRDHPIRTVSHEDWTRGTRESLQTSYG